jgi:hypothetical protein
MAPPRTMRLAGRADGPLTAVSPADHLAPVAATSRARLEAAAAIAICATCPVRGHCLTCRCGTGTSASTACGAA